MPTQPPTDTTTAIRAPFIIGVAGGSGSGKTTVTERVIDTVGVGSVAIFAQDYYYRDQTDTAPEQRRAINYDHPEAFDWELMLRHLLALRDGEPVFAPIYDFTSDNRSSQTLAILPAPIIVVEGILALYDRALRNIYDLKVFVDADADVRFIRRLERDVRERGRTPESVIHQYLDQVRPSHLQFIEPTKRYADVIIPHGGHNTAALDMLAARIQMITGFGG
jgi:uridine kinase